MINTGLEYFLDKMNERPLNQIAILLTLFICFLLLCYLFEWRFEFHHLIARGSRDTIGNTNSTTKIVLTTNNEIIV